MSGDRDFAVKSSAKPGNHGELMAPELGTMELETMSGLSRPEPGIGNHGIFLAPWS